MCLTLMLQLGKVGPHRPTYANHLEPAEGFCNCSWVWMKRRGERKGKEGKGQVKRGRRGEKVGREEKRSRWKEKEGVHPF